MSEPSRPVFLLPAVAAVCVLAGVLLGVLLSPGARAGGPRGAIEVRGGVPVGVSDTPGGALAAADNYLAAASQSVEQNPALFAALVAQVYAPGIRAATLAQASRVRAQDARIMGDYREGGRGIALLAARRLDTIYVAVLFFPVALAAAIWPVLAGWPGRLRRLLLLLVILKPVALIVLSLAGGAAAAGLSFGEGFSASVGTILAATVILALAAFAPWALMYLLAADAESAAAGESSGGPSGGGASGGGAPGGGASPVQAEPNGRVLSADTAAPAGNESSGQPAGQPAGELSRPGGVGSLSRGAESGPAGGESGPARGNSPGRGGTPGKPRLTLISSPPPDAADGPGEEGEREA